jgi:Spy/CpxP family protein refolding chaperone
VKLLTTELKLTPQQQQSVRKILEDQRQQVARAWSDTSVPSAVRVKATQAIGDRTADQIRALLTEEQRAKYVKPRQPGTSAASADVEQWMNAAARRNP